MCAHHRGFLLVLLVPNPLSPLLTLSLLALLPPVILSPGCSL